MTRDLTTSAIERQNILNNNMAILRIKEVLDIETFQYEGKYYLTKQMVAEFYEVDIRTIDNYLASNEKELKHNGYFLCKGKKLKEIKLQFAHEKTFATKTTQLSLFDFRAFLNIGMLLAESEKAKKVRSLILDIVISTINEKAGGGTKYINWRDREYLPAAINLDLNDFRKFADKYKLVMQITVDARISVSAQIETAMEEIRKQETTVMSAIILSVSFNPSYPFMMEELEGMADCLNNLTKQDIEVIWGIQERANILNQCSVSLFVFV